MTPTKEQLEAGRNTRYRVYSYFRSFCDLNSTCGGCDPVVRFWCKLKKRIEHLQQRRILRICKPEAARKE